MTAKLSNIDIAQHAKMLRITDVARDRLGIPEEALEAYGKYKAKISLNYLSKVNGKPDGKLVLVTAISPTPAGEGKTTTTVGLGDALNLIGKKALICLREPALGPVFGVDYQLIRDGTYLVAVRNEELVGCGGWSRRQALFGGDRGRPGEDALLDPARDAARIRAFFVHPAWARRGIGRSILEAGEAALQAAGFGRAELVATLAGEPLYTAAGYSVKKRYVVLLSHGLTLEVVFMTKDFPRRS